MQGSAILGHAIVPSEGGCLGVLPGQQDHLDQHQLRAHQLLAVAVAAVARAGTGFEADPLLALGPVLLVLPLELVLAHCQVQVELGR